MAPARTILSLAVAAATLAAAVPAGAHTPTGARGGGPVAAAASDSETIATRTRFFGAENVDQRTGAVRRDRAIFSWFGVTNFALAVRGHVILLDAWVPRGSHSGYVPVSPTELAKLKPEAILLGHAHFDHAADAVPVALASGAPIVGTAEHCDDMRARSPAMQPRCVPAIPAGAGAGVSAELDLLRGVELTVLKHLHSAATAPDGEEGFHVPVIPPPSGTALEHPPTPEDLVHLLGHLPDSEGGTLLWRFRLGDTSIVWHDSTGPLTDRAPALLDRLRALGPVDIQLGAIQGFNQFTNGMRDPRQYIEALRPDTFVPTHMDDWAFPITTKAVNYEAPFYEELARIPPDRRPRVRFIHDPADYVNPAALTFPVSLDPLRLGRRCGRRGRLRVALRGDVADVTTVRFRLGRRTKPDSARPFRVIFKRVARARARRVRARVVEVDGRAQRFRRSLPRCARR